jgi:NADH-quinone oxidoreductase subunit H
MFWSWLDGLPEVVQALIRVLCVVLPILLLVPGLIWYERRLLSWMQDRIGPNISGTFPKNFPIKFLRGRGTFGLIQPILDGVKLFLKEDITPSHVDRLIYFIAPGVALFPAFALGMTMAWGPVDGPLAKLSPVADINVGLLYVLAISSLGVYGVVLAGYSSNNKYSLMGGLRSSAQLISYELAMGMAVACVVLASGSLKMTDIVRFQMEPLWGVVPALQNWLILTPYGFLAAIIFAVCIVAETNRAPFDLPEAENELIAGYHTEYSSMKFAVFFMGEYAAMFIFSGIFAVLFLGGFNLLPINFPEGSVMHAINYWGAPLWFLGKCAFGITVFVWLRATLPRLRYDQLMKVGWRSLLPLAVANFIVVAMWILATNVYGQMAGWGALLGAYAVMAICVMAFTRGGAKKSPAMEVRRVRMVSESPRVVSADTEPTGAAGS